MRNSLIVLNYNDHATTSEFVSMASKIGCLDKIIVVDNNSSDDSFEILGELAGDRVDVIRTEKNGGYAYGNNFGCRYAIEKYDPDVLFVSNPDVEFEEKVIEDMQQALSGGSKAGVVAPIVNQGYNVWDLPTYTGVIETVFMLWFTADKKRIKNRLIASSNTMETVGVVEGSFWAVSKDAYKEAGGLDERTFLYYEENIFAKRLKNIGYDVAVLTKDRYDHFHSVSIRKRYGGKIRAYKHFATGMKLYLKEYLGVGKVRELIFDIAYALGFLERVLYDILYAVFANRKHTSGKRHRNDP